MAEPTKDNQAVDAPKAMSFGGGSAGGRDFGGRRRREPSTVERDKQFDERTLHIDRVARVVKGGRRFRFRALVVVGDRKNKVGIGISKGADVSTAVSKATEVAKKQMISVNLFKGTLPHDAETKVGGAHVRIMPAGTGTGLIAGGAIRTVLEVAGVTNALSKSLGSNNKVNVAYATVKALESLVPASEWVTNSGKRVNAKTTKPATKPTAEATSAKTAEAKAPSKAKAAKSKSTAKSGESK